MRSFDEATTWTPDGDRWVGQIPEDWGQGRTAFGAVAVGAALRVMRGLAGPDRPPRDVSARFVGPIRLDEPAALTAQVLRAGRSLTTIEARVAQGDRVGVTATASFGAARPSGVAVRPPGRPSGLRAPAECPEMPHLPGLMPAFTKQFAYRYTEGAFPYAGSEQTRLSGWCHHRTPATGAEAACALIDAWPAPVLQMFQRPSPASSVSWTVHLIGSADAPADDWWWFQSQAVAAGGGYATTRGALYGPSGEMVAWSEQLVAVFDER